MIPVEEIQAGDLVTLPLAGERPVIRVERYPADPELAARGLETYARDAFVVVYNPGGPGLAAGGQSYDRDEASLAIKRAGDLVPARRPGYDRQASHAGGEQTRSRSRLADNSPPAAPLSSAPTAARARSTDPATSHAAARSVQLRDAHEAIRRLFRELGPMSDELLVERYVAATQEGLRPAQSPSGIRTRRHDLAEAGVLVVSGQATTPAGRACNVWALSQRPLEVYDPEPEL